MNTETTSNMPVVQSSDTQQSVASCSFVPLTPARFVSTWLQGYVEINYDTLVEVFGPQHNNGDGYKVDAEWDLMFSDGTIATIYNWKNGKNYDEDDGLEVSEITEWHVGGISKLALTRVQEAIKLKCNTLSTNE